MDKYTNNEIVEEMDAIILLNDNYVDKGLKKGYIGIVMDNMIEKFGYVVADFANPITGESIQPVIQIKKEDFKVFNSNSRSDQLIGKQFKDLFRK